jgi:hypothetical protein
MTHAQKIRQQIEKGTPHYGVSDSVVRVYTYDTSDTSETAANISRVSNCSGYWKEKRGAYLIPTLTILKGICSAERTVEVSPTFDIKLIGNLFQNIGKSDREAQTWI